MVGSTDWFKNESLIAIGETELLIEKLEVSAAERKSQSRNVSESQKISLLQENLASSKTYPFTSFPLRLSCLRDFLQKMTPARAELHRNNYSSKTAPFRCVCLRYASLDTVTSKAMHDFRALASLAILTTVKRTPHSFTKVLSDRLPRDVPMSAMQFRMGTLSERACVNNISRYDFKDWNQLYKGSWGVVLAHISKTHT